MRQFLEALEPLFLVKSILNSTRIPISFRWVILTGSYDQKV